MRFCNAFFVLAALVVPACSTMVAVDQSSGVTSATSGGGASGSATTTGGSTAGGGGAGGVDACAPLTCQQQGFDCGAATDGCGGPLDCGTCAPPGSCGSSGLPNVCGPCTQCVPSTCADLNVWCGAADDGCGNIIECGTCMPPPPGCCGAVTSPSFMWSCGVACDVLTCADVGVSCGIVPNGCGDELDCGSCTLPETCGGGGQPGVCGIGACTPVTCADQGYQCGPAGDGCGNVLDCGSCDPCTPGCGQDTTPGHCLAVLVAECVPSTCADLGYTCGGAGDGCGHGLDCGACAAGLTCVKGQCVPGCE